MAENTCISGSGEMDFLASTRSIVIIERLFLFRLAAGLGVGKCIYTVCPGFLFCPYSCLWHTGARFVVLQDF